MSDELPGGSVLNSSLLGEEEANDVSAYNATHKNFALKAGIVVDLFEIDDERNLGKLGPEYDVLVIEQDENKGINAIRYKNCVTAESFGNISDFFEVKLRKQTKEEGDAGRNPAKQNGSLVLLLCLDGAAEKGIILKALKHPSRKEKLDKSLHMHGEYNGLNIQVDKDGAFKLEFKGPRDDNGKYTNTKAGGSYMEIDKTGKIELNSGNNDYIKIDKEKKDISVNAGNNISGKAKKDISLDAGANVNVKSGKDFAFMAGAKANFESSSTFDIKAGGPFSLKSPSIEMLADGTFKVMSPQITLDGLSFVGGLGGVPSLLQTTKFQGIGNLGAPVISEAIGPFSSKVFIAM